MRPIQRFGLAMMLMVSITVGTSAQPPGPVQRPSFSPYLNLARQNVNPAVSYYGIVRPQNQTAASFQDLNSRLDRTQLGADLGADQPLVTGSAFGFQNHTVYFQNQFLSGQFNGQGIPKANTSNASTPTRYLMPEIQKQRR